MKLTAAAAAAAVLCLWLAAGKATVRGKSPETQHVLKLLNGDLQLLAAGEDLHFYWRGLGPGLELLPASPAR